VGARLHALLAVQQSEHPVQRTAAMAGHSPGAWLLAPADLRCPYQGDGTTRALRWDGPTAPPSSIADYRSFFTTTPSEKVAECSTNDVILADFDSSNGMRKAVATPGLSVASILSVAM
jgi:hypothetical protein